MPAISADIITGRGHGPLLHSLTAGIEIYGSGCGGLPDGESALLGQFQFIIKIFKYSKRVNND